jgi:hypothetical protein
MKKMLKEVNQIHIFISSSGSGSSSDFLTSYGSYGSGSCSGSTTEFKTLCCPVLDKVGEHQRQRCGGRQAGRRPRPHLDHHPLFPGSGDHCAHAQSTVPFSFAVCQMSRDEILGHQFTERLESFAPCY